MREAAGTSEGEGFSENQLPCVGRGVLPAGSVGGGLHGVLEAGAECTQRRPGERGSSHTGLSWEPTGERQGVEGPQTGERELGLWLSKIKVSEQEKKRESSNSREQVHTHTYTHTYTHKYF